MSHERILSVRLKNTSILGAIDILDIYGIKPKKLSTAVNTALDILIENLRQGGKLPIYTEEEASILLEETFSGVGKEPPAARVTAKERRAEAFAHDHLGLTNDDFAPAVSAIETVAPPGLTSELEMLIQESIREIELQDEADLLESIRVTEPIVPILQTRQTTAVDIMKQPMLSLQDILATKAYQRLKDDGIAVLAIRIVYFSISPTQWDSDLAYRLIEEVILQIKGA